MDYRIVKTRPWPRHFPFARYDVMLAIPVVNSLNQVHERYERYAGGFWTRRGAQKWIDNEGGQ